MTRTFEKDGNILPSIINLVNSIPEEQIFSQQYLLRHPKIIVAKSFKRVFSAFDNLLIIKVEIEDYYKKSNEFANYNFEPLSKSILELLESLNSFIEDCQHLFKATTPFTEDNQKIVANFVSDWLKKAKHPTQKDFFESIKQYKEEISYYINNYKHEHGRIDIIPGYYQNEIVIGYVMKFIGETPNGNMEILDLNKIRTLPLDINYHFYQFYNISESFTKNLIKAQKIFYGIEIKLLKFNSNQYNVDKIIKRMKFENLLIFPNNDLFSPKLLIELNDISLNFKYPFGITEQNTKHIKLLQINNKPYPENSLIAIPTEKTIKIMEDFLHGNRKDGDKLELSLDGSESYLKIFVTYKNVEKNYTYIELNYDNLFTIKSYTNIQMPLQFESDIFSKLHVKIFDINYLGITMSIKK